MKNLITYLSKKSLSLGNGSGMTRKWLGNDAGMTRFSLVSLICLCMLTIGVGNAWGVNYSWNLATNSYSSSSTSSVTWSNSNCNMVLTKNTSEQNANAYLGGGDNTQTRMYTGQKLTFTPASGKIVTRVEATTTSNYSDEFAGATWTNASGSNPSTTLAVIIPTNGANAFYGVFSSATRIMQIRVFYRVPDANCDVFCETFDNMNSTGGNDDSWSGSIATGTIGTSPNHPDMSTWTFAYGYAGSACVKLGTTSYQGVATTPSIAVTSGKKYTLTYKAGAWSSDNCSLTLSASGANITTAVSPTGNLSKGSFTEYTAVLTATSSSMTITFTGQDKRRFFLDEICVTEYTCPKKVTLSDGSPSNGTITFDPEGPVLTCDEAVEVEMTITPSAGYQLTGWTSSGVSPTDIDPAIATSGDDSKSAQTVTLTFAADANGTYTAGATFTAMTDHFIDKVWNTSGYTGSGMEKTGNYSASKPTISDHSAVTSGTCQELHYHFAGWVTAEYKDNPSGHIVTLDGYASGTTYYAVWEKQSTSGGGDVSDVINNSVTYSHLGSDNTSTWVSVWETSAMTSGAKYKIYSMGINGATDYALQWNSSGYLFTSSAPSSGLKVKSISVKTKGADKSVNLFGSTTVYTSVASATSLGSLTGTTSGATYSLTSAQLANNYTCVGVNGGAKSTQIVSVTITYSGGASYEEPITSCCDNYITIADVTKTGVGTVVFSESSPVATCDDDVSFTATVTPAAGYSCTALSFSGGDVGISPAISVPNTSATVYTLSFDQNTNATLNTTVTFTAKPMEGWSWKYKKGADVADGSVDPYEVPLVVESYIDEYVRFVIDGYSPADVISDKQGYVYTAGGVQPVYSTTYLTYVGKDANASYLTIKGKAATEESTTIVFKSVGNADVTQTFKMKINALPTVTFVDLIHNKVDFTNSGSGYTASTGVLTSTVTTGVVSHSGKTPAHSDIDGPESGNDCELSHLHLIGWIRSDYSKVANYLNGTGSAPTDSEITSAGTDDGGLNYYFTPDVSIDIEDYNGFTFYAVWATIE